MAQSHLYATIELMAMGTIDSCSRPPIEYYYCCFGQNNYIRDLMVLLLPFRHQNRVSSAAAAFAL